MIAQPVDAAATAGVRRLVEWLEAIGNRHDLTLSGPGGAYDAALSALLAVFSNEFRAYRDVVAGAREAAGGNVANFTAIVRAIDAQGAHIRTAAGAAADCERSASAMSEAAESLSSSTYAAEGAATQAGAKLAAIAEVLAALTDGLTACDAPLAEMVKLTAQIASFPETLARLSRHAQLLGVNASIEAAHLAEAGARFEIVAAEVRKLSTSTAASKADVTRIIGELRTSTGHVERAMRESRDATGGAKREISGARESVNRIAVGVDRLGGKVTTVADVAGTQSMALAAIGASVAQIADAAAAAARASSEAARLDLDSLLARAAERAAQWRVRESENTRVHGDDPFSAWIAALVRGADVAEPSAVDGDRDLTPLVAAVRTLVERVNADQRAILSQVVNVAVAVARNGYSWVSIDAAQQNIGDELVVVRETLVSAVEAARTSAHISGEMSGVVDEIRGQYDAVLQLLEGALALVARIGNSVDGIVGFVESMTGAAARADEIMELIETLSSETDLLSLNAAIESAHAGELGLGFGVIAEEIRALAGSTNESTTRVSKLVSTIAGVSASLQTCIVAAGSHTSEIIAGAEEARAAIGALQSAFEAAETRARDVAGNAAAQSRALESVSDTIARSGTGTDPQAAEHSAKCRLELALLGSSAHAVAGRRPIGTAVARVRRLLEPLCATIESVLESAVSSGRVSLDRLCDLSYTPIEGTAVASLGRLFDVSRVPREGFSPPKYATPWDAAVDESAIAALSDAWPALTAEPFGAVSIVVSDLNGFLYAYPRAHIAAWTNDPARDSGGNRIKRIFEDEYSLRVVRTGMGRRAGALGPRCTYDAFRSAGCELAQGAERPWGAYVYARDTSDVFNDIALGLFVRGTRIGTVRFIYDPNVI